MTIPEILKISYDLGIEEVIYDKKLMIQHIQIIEGNRPCFGSGVRDCHQYDCRWRDDCIQQKKYAEKEAVYYKKYARC